MCSLWSVAICSSNGGSVREKGSIQITPKEARVMLQQQGRLSLVRGSGMSAFERMEPTSLAGAPKWMKRPGRGVCDVEEGGRYRKFSQLNVRYDNGRGQSLAA